MQKPGWKSSTQLMKRLGGNTTRVFDLKRVGQSSSRPYGILSIGQKTIRTKFLVVGHFAGGTKPPRFSFILYMLDKSGMGFVSLQE